MKIDICLGDKTRCMKLPFCKVPPGLCAESYKVLGVLAMFSGFCFSLEKMLWLKKNKQNLNMGQSFGVLIL